MLSVLYTLSVWEVIIIILLFILNAQQDTVI